jgi:hypothetical protein
MTDFPHLPPGREPGAQSLRNRQGVPLLWWFVGIVGIGMFLGGVFIVAGGRGPGFNFWEERIGGTIFGGMGLFCASVAYSQYRKFRPSPLRRRMPGVNLAVDRDEARRGEKISATLDHPPRAEGLEVGIVCVERYDLQANAQTRGAVIVVRETNQWTAYEQWQEVEPGAGEQTLTIEIPRDAPYSYEGDCVSYAWRVSARRVRMLRSDARIDVPIWVAW